MADEVAGAPGSRALGHLQRVVYDGIVAPALERWTEDGGRYLEQTATEVERGARVASDAVVAAMVDGGIRLEAARIQCELMINSLLRGRE